MRRDHSLVPCWHKCEVTECPPDFLSRIVRGHPGGGSLQINSPTCVRSWPAPHNDARRSAATCRAALAATLRSRTGHSRRVSGGFFVSSETFVQRCWCAVRRTRGHYSDDTRPFRRDDRACRHAVHRAGTLAAAAHPRRHSLPKPAAQQWCGRRPTPNRESWN